ncbi:hypothetical protein LTS08_007917 [Lithohypha guttulata]|uniref:Thioredoxin domain-containing protein n=1 Tax=Lithohypha guttulata TaxID=1690604 RepID=A0AAN7PJZ0_9EURO|nr:hypothetical protein LTR51_007939 [Lithohypha guttulata]KAK5080554.1 hypothetical protein LTR05_008497 [Lithohypha guttulata]KAK5095782.1 hypothetical protein LTS08_007917 [Lithohypha guttulata]
MTVYEVSDASEFKYDNLVVDLNTLVFILFYDSNGVSSQAILQWVENLSNSMDCASVRFHKNDVVESDELAEEYHIKHFPTCLFLKGGQVVDKLQTPRDEEVVKEAVMKNQA